MTKREVRKTAYRHIVNEGKSHQQTYNDLRVATDTETDLLASEVSKIPSKNKRAKLKGLIYAYVGILALIITLRLLGGMAFFEESRINQQGLLFFILLGIIAPIYGIYGALTARVESYTTLAAVLALNIFRSVRYEPNFEDPILLLGYLPFLAGIVLGIIIPMKLKTKYTKAVTKKEVDGNMKSITKVTYEKDQAQDDDLLDSQLN
ncbi:MAG: hypothetical protein ACI865_000904 [Flavobacteriaceae bacterium]|jgi:hypothetical protein